MFDAIVFNAVNALEFHEVRRNVIRIPEVINCARKAQKIWDQISTQELDFSNFVASDDSTFLGNLRLKNLATAVIQMGLLERFLRFHKMPNMVAGLTNGDSALKVAIGQMTFDELLQASQSHNKVKLQLMNSLSTLPILTGISLAEFGLFKAEEDERFEPVLEKEMDFRRVLYELVKQGAKKIVVVGPGAGHVQNLLRERLSEGVEVVDSLALDANLSWFWQEPSRAQQAAAHQ